MLEREDGWHMASEKADYARVRTHLLVGVTSSSLAVAAATTFIALAALLSFVPEPQDTGNAWTLHGTLAPNDMPDVPLPDGAKRV